jgi:hypothetical protein
MPPGEGSLVSSFGALLLAYSNGVPSDVHAYTHHGQDAHATLHAMKQEKLRREAASDNYRHTDNDCVSREHAEAVDAGEESEGEEPQRPHDGDFISRRLIGPTHVSLETSHNLAFRTRHAQPRDTGRINGPNSPD